MTKTEQIRALKQLNSVIQRDNEDPMSLHEFEELEDVYKVISKMPADNERIWEEIKHLMKRKEFESNLQQQIIEVGRKYVNKKIGRTYTVTEAWEGIKQALKAKGSDE